jgi:hypothetical protein
MGREETETTEFYAREAVRKARDTIAFSKAHGVPNDIVRKFEWAERYLSEGLREVELLKLEPANA